MDGLAFSQKKVSSKENERKGSKIGNKSRHVSDGVATLTFDNSCRKSWPVLRMKKCLNLCCKWHSLFLIFLSDVLAIGLFFFEALRAISRPLITKQKGKVAVYHRFWSLGITRLWSRAHLTLILNHRWKRELYFLLSLMLLPNKAQGSFYTPCYINVQSRLGPSFSTS